MRRARWLLCEHASSVSALDCHVLNFFWAEPGFLHPLLSGERHRHIEVKARARRSGNGKPQFPPKETPAPDDRIGTAARIGKRLVVRALQRAGDVNGLLANGDAQVSTLSTEDERRDVDRGAGLRDRGGGCTGQRLPQLGKCERRGAGVVPNDVRDLRGRCCRAALRAARGGSEHNEQS
jgi:hypothetical protein